MKISELTPKANFDILELEIIEKYNPKEFEKYGKTLRVCDLIGTDDSGQVKISLWNEEIDKFDKGDKIKITNGWCDSYKDTLQITAGKTGKIEKLKVIEIKYKEEFKEIPEFEEKFTDEFIEELDRPLF